MIAAAIENIRELLSPSQYACTLLPHPEDGYSVRCAAFPEMVSHGDTLEEARAAAREALELCLEV